MTVYTTHRIGFYGKSENTSEKFPLRLTWSQNCGVDMSVDVS